MREWFQQRFADSQVDHLLSLFSCRMHKERPALAEIKLKAQSFFIDLVSTKNKTEINRSSRRLTNPATAWTKTKEAITTQTRLLRFAWGVGIMSTVVLTGYTVQVHLFKKN